MVVYFHILISMQCGISNLFTLYISSSKENSSAGERRTHWATSWRWKIKGEGGGQRTIWFSYNRKYTVHSFMAMFLLFPHRWSSTCAWHVGVEVMKIDSCFVMGVTTVITPSVWSHPSTMSPKVTGDAPSAWLRWATPDCICKLMSSLSLYLFKQRFTWGH